jgi:hypothetical protein
MISLRKGINIMRRIPGSHVPNIKNRSSKHLGCLTKMKSALWSMSGDALKTLSKSYNGKFNIFDAEIERRARNADKRKTPRPSSKKNIEG